MINESIHSCKPFLHCFILQLLSKLCDLFVSCVFFYRSMCSIYMVSKPQWKIHLSSLDLHLDHFFLEKLLLPVLHQKRRIHHLISQVRKLLIKLSWSTMMGVKEIPKVQTVDLTLYVWLFYRLSTLFTTFTTSSPFFSLHSLQDLSPPYCIQNGSFSRAPLPSTITSGRKTWW